MSKAFCSEHDCWSHDIQSLWPPWPTWTMEGIIKLIWCQAFALPPFRRIHSRNIQLSIHFALSTWTVANATTAETSKQARNSQFHVIWYRHTCTLSLSRSLARTPTFWITGNCHAHPPHHSCKWNIHIFSFNFDLSNFEFERFVIFCCFLSMSCAMLKAPPVGQ